MNAQGVKCSDFWVREEGVFFEEFLKSRYRKLFVLDKNDKIHTIEISWGHDVQGGRDLLKDSLHRE
jgi:hypothetical protein